MSNCSFLFSGFAVALYAVHMPATSTDQRSDLLHYDQELGGRAPIS